jgi:hypothetical protein
MYQLFYEGDEPPKPPNLLKRRSSDDIVWGRVPARAPGCGVHRSEAKTLDRRSGRIRGRFSKEGHGIEEKIAP